MITGEWFVRRAWIMCGGLASGGGGAVGWGVGVVVAGVGWWGWFGDGVCVGWFGMLIFGVWDVKPFLTLALGVVLGGVGSPR